MYERFNSILESIETNGHPDEAETILTCWWIRVHQLHNYLERLPEGATAAEKAVLQQLCSYGEERGTLLSMTESLHGQEPVIKTSAVHSRFVNLCELDDTGEIYLAVLEFAQCRWPDLNLVSDLELGNPNGRLFLSNRSAKPLQFVHRNTIRYGCETSLRTDTDQFALILRRDGCRYPVKILRHFQLEVALQEPVTCMVVSRLDMNNVPLMPWSLHADDLGYYVAIDNSFEPPKAISPDQLVSAVTTGTFQMLNTGRHLRIVVAYDRTRCEIFDAPAPEGFDGGGA
ncbi:hypothetical protein FS749_008656 [Ceratobasidium sp. UAMH 11750]|nr:hypothetical protein FS749_008656 [Ceratobasidium sp. UAMH 11750]